ncbi:vitelline membrane outer layer protein 1 homolog isoform X2 [Limanda limanda]|uniref:vitelline membrane outer layer protein 1 homolog isoform X2 n=1 Tax=Limanda limanda TaxID=27771 RepID=UPI0029C6EE7B|nr:vitelline membrane outer layer protein 1 homolog isoform X2 [Limanda limanda]
MESLLRAVAVLTVLFVGLFQHGAVVDGRSYTSVLTVTNGQQYGTWRWPVMCPDQYFAVGFSIRVEDYQQYPEDNTAMNGIRLICRKDGDRSLTYSMYSHGGFWGDWSSSQYCPRGVLTSFQLRVEAYQGWFHDDTAVNNIRFRCSNGHVLQGTGMNWGEYGYWSQDCGKGGICGIETRMVENGGYDESSLNDVRFRCCYRASR